MSIQELFTLVEPNQQAIDCGSVKAVCKKVGITLPEDFVQIGLCYGFGEFHGGGARLHYFAPTSDGYAGYVLDELDGWKDQCRALDIDDLLFYPIEGGILPMGRFDNGVRLAFVCSGPPHEWTIMLFDNLEKDSRHFFRCSSCEFLIRTLGGELLGPLLGVDEADSKSVDFIPYMSDGWNYANG